MKISKAGIATLIIIPSILILAFVSIHFDSIANSLNWTLGTHSVSYAVFPEIGMIGLVSIWAAILFNDWKIALILGIPLGFVLIMETQTYIGNWFWSLFA